MQKYSARKRKMHKYSAHNRKYRNVQHTKRKMQHIREKMQQMRQENSRSKSEPDVGSSAGVGCGVDSWPVLAGRGGGGATARPLARSLAPLGWLSTTRDKEAQHRARAPLNKPHPAQQNTYTGVLGSLALRALSGPRRWLLGCGGRRRQWWSISRYVVNLVTYRIHHPK